MCPSGLILLYWNSQTPKGSIPLRRRLDAVLALDMLSTSLPSMCSSMQTWGLARGTELLILLTLVIYGGSFRPCDTPLREYKLPGES